MWFKYYNRHFGEIKNFACEEINERSFSNPHPRVAIASNRGLIRSYELDKVYLATDFIHL